VLGAADALAVLEAKRRELQKPVNLIEADFEAVVPQRDKLAIAQQHRLETVIDEPDKEAAASGEPVIEPTVAELLAKRSSPS
jgi:hypothetical protein